MRSMGYYRGTNVVGRRADEMRRVAKQQARYEAGKERCQSAWPLVKARVQKHHIWLFWLGENLNPKSLLYPLPMGFDLGLWPYEGNCDYCFLKGLAVLGFQERERPGSIDDWIDMERAEEHTSELQSLMRISYAVFCLKKIRMQKKETNKTKKEFTPITKKYKH